MLGAAGKGWADVIDCMTVFFEAPLYALHLQWQLNVYFVGLYQYR